MMEELKVGDWIRIDGDADEAHKIVAIGGKRVTLDSGWVASVYNVNKIDLDKCVIYSLTTNYWRKK